MTEQGRPGITNRADGTPALCFGGHHDFDLRGRVPKTRLDADPRRDAVRVEPVDVDRVHRVELPDIGQPDLDPDESGFVRTRQRQHTVYFGKRLPGLPDNVLTEIGRGKARDIDDVPVRY